jgi:hypothetical protein
MKIYKLTVGIKIDGFFSHCESYEEAELPYKVAEVMEFGEEMVDDTDDFFEPKLTVFTLDVSRLLTLEKEMTDEIKQHLLSAHFRFAVYKELFL